MEISNKQFTYLEHTGAVKFPGLMTLHHYIHPSYLNANRWAILAFQLILRAYSSPKILPIISRLSDDLILFKSSFRNNKVTKRQKQRNVVNADVQRHLKSWTSAATVHQNRFLLFYTVMCVWVGVIIHWPSGVSETWRVKKAFPFWTLVIGALDSNWIWWRRIYSKESDDSLLITVQRWYQLNYCRNTYIKSTNLAIYGNNKSKKSENQLIHGLVDYYLLVQLPESK